MINNKVLSIILGEAKDRDYIHSQKVDPNQQFQLLENTDW